MILLCPECEALWNEPDGARLFTVQPDSTLPDADRSVWGDQTHWATRAEIEAKGWDRAIVGEHDEAEPPSADQRDRIDRQTQQIAAATQPPASGIASVPAWNDHPRTAAIRDMVAQLGPVHRITMARSEPGGDERAMLRACLEFVLSFSPVAMEGGAVTSPRGRGLVATLELGEADAVVATIDVSSRLPSRQWVEIACEAGSIVCDDLFSPPRDQPSRFWIHGGEHEGSRTFDPVAADATVSGPPLQSQQAETLAARIYDGARTDQV